MYGTKYDKFLPTVTDYDSDDSSSTESDYDEDDEVKYHSSYGKTKYKWKLHQCRFVKNFNAFKEISQFVMSTKKYVINEYYKTFPDRDGNEEYEEVKHLFKEKKNNQYFKKIWKKLKILNQNL